MSALATVTGADIAIMTVVFSIDGQAVLTAFEAPFRFVLPTDRWIDGDHLLEAKATLEDDAVSQQTGIQVRFANGVTSPPPTTDAFTPTSGTRPATGKPFVLAAVGDGAGGSASSAGVTDLIDSFKPNLFLYLGDVYNAGTSTEFANWYRPDRFFGRFRAITDPTVGNHEYGGQSEPRGYMDYWGNPPHFYSFDAAGWHLISLDSTDRFNQTDQASEQYRWLAQDLRASRAACTIVYFHHPVFSVGPHGGTGSLTEIWSLLAKLGVDIVLTGHDHNYQRWQPLDDQGRPSPSGVTSFVVGTGGQSQTHYDTTDDRLAFGTDENSGALRLELNPGGAAYRFEGEHGVPLDAGSVPCTGAPADDTRPSTPAHLTASATDGGGIDVRWDPSTDNVGVAEYRLYRDGEFLVSVAAPFRYVDDVRPGHSYSYSVRARDAAGNESSPSKRVAATSRSAALFSDTFEGGTLEQWTIARGLSVEAGAAPSDDLSVRATSSGEATYARKALDPAQSDLSYRLRFMLLAQGSNPVTLLRMRAGEDASIIGFYISEQGDLGSYNDVTRSGLTSSTHVSPDEWHELEVHVHVAGLAGRVDVTYDGGSVAGLSGTANLGARAIGEVQLGDSATKRGYDLRFDDVVVDTADVAGIASPQARQKGPAATGIDDSSSWTSSRPTLLDSWLGGVHRYV